MTTISLIAAVSENGVIGKNGKIPWRLPTDLKRFKGLTVGHPVIMGRKTFESILEATGKILPERLNIVVTRQVSYRVPLNAEVVHTLEEALAEAKKWEEKAALENTSHQKEIFVIGGAEIYALALAYANFFYLAEVRATIPDGDVFFPKWNVEEWVDIIAPEIHEADEENEYGYAFRILTRKGHEEKPRGGHIDLANVRLPEQRAAMERILLRNHCPFCPENLALEHKEPVLRESTHWVLTKNQWPYPNTKTHLLLILKEHAEIFSALPSEARNEFFELLSWAIEKFSIQGGGVCMRFGDTELSGGTVRHLHAQLIVPDRESPTYERTCFYVGSKK